MDYQISTALAALFPSKARRAVLQALFAAREDALSISEIARRASLTQRAISVEIHILEQAGLVLVEALGAAHVVRPNPLHPLTEALRPLFSRASAGPGEKRLRSAVDRRSGLARAALAACGAPLPDEPSSAPTPTVVGAVLDGLELARRDAEVLLSLPPVVARHVEEIEWTELEEQARRRRLKAELGFVLDLTADLAGLPWLRDHAARLADGRRRVPRYLPEARSEPERRLADARSLPIDNRWNFRLNLTMEDFRRAFRRGLARGLQGRSSESEPLLESLRDLDAEVTEPTEVTVLGDAAAALRIGALGSRMPLDLAPPGSPRHYPFAWRDRRLRVEVPGLTRLQVFVPERHDWAVARGASGIAADLQSVEALHRLDPMRLGVLIARHHEAEGEAAGTDPSVHLAFLALVERLFGTDARVRVAGSAAAEPRMLKWRKGHPLPRVARPHAAADGNDGPS